MLRKFRADLHIHTCLSPCGSLGMVPGVIVEEAGRRGLEVIGICDHNSAENAWAVRKAAEKKKIAVLGGMEITSQEEVHVLALFGEDEKLLKLQKIVYDNLPGVNDERVFGEQVIINEKDEVVDISRRLLVGATTLPLGRIVQEIQALGGVAIASHVDRESFGIIGQLGFIPEGLELDALEVSPRSTLEQARAAFPELEAFPLVTFSDAHYPQDIGRRWTGFVAESPEPQEIKKALMGREGRAVFFEE
jgi:PHP family Zn ribbon phosphoesterase